MMKKTLVFVTLFLLLLGPIFAFNTYAQSYGKSVPLENPLGANNPNLIALIGNLLKIAAQIGGIVCVFFIIYSGFLFIKAQGEPAELTKAKSVFFWSIVGAGVLLGASVIASLIQGTVNSVLK